MGKWYLTGEDSDITSTVSPGRVMRVTRGASTWALIPSAQSTICATAFTSSETYLKGILVPGAPATAASIVIYDTYICASGVSGFGTSGANVIAVFGLDASGQVCAIAAADGYPKYIPLNIYCTSGLTIAVGLSATDKSSRLGHLSSGCTVFYTAQ